MEDYTKTLASFLDEKLPGNGIVFDALTYAEQLHSGQFRKSKEPYMIHPMAVIKILATGLGVKDPKILAAALLHDVVEDVEEVGLTDIAGRFGKTVGELVDGCTKISVKRLDKATLKNLTHSKILTSASQRLGVLLIKLADRLHNINTLEHLEHAKRQRIAQETIDIYVPLAARLNLFDLKRSLHQKALPYLYKKKSKQLKRKISRLVESSVVAEIQSTIEQTLSELQFPFRVNPRVKGLGAYYSTLQKTLDVSNVENEVDFCIVLATDNYLECYTVIGMINNLFNLIPGSMRDFITNPKPNGYQSLHARVAAKGKSFLVKIRTGRMETDARHGLLNRLDITRPGGNRYAREIGDLLRLYGEYTGSAGGRKELIRREQSDDIVVLSPNGEAIFLPKGSIALDFAYKIHTELGNCCGGALINNQPTSITQELRDGDRVEIVKSAGLDAGAELENLCKSTKARNEVNRLLNDKRQAYAAEIGKAILYQETMAAGLDPTLLERETMPAFLEFKRLDTPEDLHRLIGQDRLSPFEVMYYAEDTAATRQGNPGRDAASRQPTLVVDSPIAGVHKFSQCCQPFPGQTGCVAVLSERGVSFHREACDDLQTRHRLKKDHIYRVRWAYGKRWPETMAFDLGVGRGERSQNLDLLRCIPETIRVSDFRGVENKKGLGLSLKICLNDFNEAKAVFACLKGRAFTISGFKRVQ